MYRQRQGLGRWACAFRHAPCEKDRGVQPQGLHHHALQHRELGVVPPGLATLGQPRAWVRPQDGTSLAAERLLDLFPGPDFGEEGLPEPYVPGGVEAGDPVQVSPEEVVRAEGVSGIAGGETLSGLDGEDKGLGNGVIFKGHFLGVALTAATSPPTCWHASP